MRFHSDDLRKEARTIAAGGKGAKQAWTELLQWAEKRGPAAKKCAMMEFLGAYGGTPEAAFVMPEIMRNASQVFSPAERTELAHLAAHRSPLRDLRPQSQMLAPKQSLPLSSSRPSLALSFKPAVREGAAHRLGAIEPITPASDPAYLRDMPIRMRDGLGTATLRAPFASVPRDPRMNAVRGDGPIHAFQSGSGNSPGSMQAGAHKGEHIVRSLIHSLRSHGRDDAPHMSPAPSAARQNPKRKAAAARSSKPARKARRRIEPAFRKKKVRRAATSKPYRKPAMKRRRK